VSVICERVGQVLVEQIVEAMAPAARVAATYGAHSSVQSACDVMDAELVDHRWRLTGSNLRRILEENDPRTFFAVVATAGTTNFGIIDDLASVAEVCADLGVWFHVDAAYGGAALAVPSMRDRFEGVERADSFIVDPHKWLFAPFDCCALIYREPALARAAHTQRGLPGRAHRRAGPEHHRLLHRADPARSRPSAVVLPRRAGHGRVCPGGPAHPRGRPASPRRRFADASTFELLRERDLSVMVFRRVGWAPHDYRAWSDRLLAEEFAFVVPTTHDGETVTRFAIVNPTTTEDDIRAILDTMI